MKNTKNGLVVTFYSYKGGVGRSFALANIGALLAMWGNKVLCADWDLESPGLSHYFDSYLLGERKPGILELIEGFKKGNSLRWQEYVTSLHFPNSNSELSFMSAGLENDTYMKRLQSLDWTQLYKKHGLGDYIEKIREEWKDEYDFILIDSHTGVTDVGGITTIQLPEVIAFFFTANYQSLNGAISVTEGVIRERKGLPYDRGSLITLPVLSRFDMREEYELGIDWLKIVADKVNPFYQNWLHKEVSVADIVNATKIPYVSYWSFGEKVAVVEDQRRDSESINYSLETLAALIAKDCSETQKLIENRDSFVGSVSNEEMPLRRRRSEEKVKLKEKCEKVLRTGNILEWRELVSRVWSSIPERMIEWKPKAERIWDKGGEKQEAARFEAVEICLPSFIPIFVALEGGREDLWGEAVGSLRQLALLHDRMGGGFTDVIEISSHMLYIAGSLGMAIATRTKQLNFVNGWMGLRMPMVRFDEKGEQLWAEVKTAHRIWGKYLPVPPDPFKDLWQICQMDYLSGFFEEKKLLEKNLFMANLAQSLYEFGRYIEDSKSLEALKAGDTDPLDLKVWPVWTIMKPVDFKEATWEMFDTSLGVFEFVSPRSGISTDDFWELWRLWKHHCAKPMISHALQRGLPTPRSEYLMLPGEPHVWK